LSEHFSVPKVNVIESSDGFSVEVLGRTGIRYVEAGRSLLVDSEVLAGTNGIMVVANSMRDWNSRSYARIDIVERKRIIDNICRAFAWSGEKIEVHPENWRDA
jgi:hypothetical protein